MISTPHKNPIGENCGKCGRPVSEEFSGSLTQWVALCRCKLLGADDVSGNTIQVCLHCGKLLRSGRSGTFTQWIFRSDVCKCENPEVIERPIKDLSDDEFKNSAVDLSSLVEIEVDETKFPLERFAPLELISTTCESKIYLSVDRLLGTRVAIKALSVYRPEETIRFQKEVKALAGLSHPGLVKVFDFAEKNGAPYMVMEYVEGGSLRQFLKLNKFLSAKDAQEVMNKLCRIISHCHSNGIFHRDIKPENVLLSDNEGNLELKLVDFGLASNFNTDSKINDTVVGTPLYMAPDVANGREYDARSEVYSLGCVMFELLTGDPPYEADRPLNLLKLHAEAQIPSLSSRMHESDFDPRLDEILARCLAKDPDERYQSVDELLSDINALGQNEPALSPLSEGRRLSIKRYYIWYVFIALALAGVLFYIWLETSTSGKKDDKKKPLVESKFDGELYDPFQVHNTGEFRKVGKEDLEVQLKNSIYKRRSVIPRFSQTDLSGGLLDDSKAIKEFHSLAFNTCRLDGRAFRALGSIPELSSLWLDNCDFKPLDLSHLSISKSLHSLTIDEIANELDKNLVSAVAKVRTLREFKYSAYGANTLSGDCLGDLESMPDLVTLRVHFQKLGKNNFNSLGRLKKLKVLDLTGSKFSSKQSTFLKDLGKIEDLRISCVDMDSNALENLLSIRQLESLTLKYSNVIADDFFQKVLKLPELRSIDLTLCKFESQKSGNFESFRGLDNLFVDDSSYMVLKNCEGLRLAHLYFPSGREKLSQAEWKRLENEYSIGSFPRMRTSR